MKKKQGQFYANIDWNKAVTLFKNQSYQSHKPTSYPPVKQLLPYIAAAGTIGIIFFFPGAAPALGTLVLGKNTFDRWKTKAVISRLHKRKLVNIEYNADGSVTVKVTKNGIRRALTYQLEQLTINKPKTWDRKWRVVIFDIPVKCKRVRDIFRERLLQLGLYKLQDSVYVSPYKCFNQIEFLREIYGVGFTARYLLVDKIEDDEEIKDQFQLH